MVFQDAPDYLIVGHLTKDNTPHGPILGGTCGYSALTAHRLGAQVGIVTSTGPDLPSTEALAGIAIHNLPADHSTTFENIYRFDGSRRQKWPVSSRQLSFDDVPPAWRSSPLVHLAPIGQEMSPAMVNHFPDSLVGATIQGWLRGRDSDNNVIYRVHPELEKWLARLDILVLSVSDVAGDRDILNRFLTTVPLGVETLGPKGCRIHFNNTVIHVPVHPEKETDPTGAGDIFAAAFFVKYRQTGDPVLSAQFANAAASLSVTRMGLAGVPVLEQVETQRQNIYG